MLQNRVRRPFLIALALVLLLPCYAFFIEPYWIEITHHAISGTVREPIKILQLSDLHVRSFGRREERVLTAIREEKPDLIVVTGDFVSDAENDDAVVRLFKELAAPLGVWVIRGNWDYWKGQNVEPRLRELSNLKFLVNENTRIRDDLWIIGLDDRFEGKPDEKLAFAGVPKGVTRLLLVHSPSPFEKIRETFDFAFTGHTHGGQLRLPFLAPIWLPPFSGDYSDGWYTHQNSRMYVSRGIGNSMLDARFNCRPEIAIFHLTPKK
jgi:predicted MPP superfamily phosphohydrolase